MKKEKLLLLFLIVFVWTQGVLAQTQEGNDWYVADAVGPHNLGGSGSRTITPEYPMKSVYFEAYLSDNVTSDHKISVLGESINLNTDRPQKWYGEADGNDPTSDDPIRRTKSIDPVSSSAITFTASRAWSGTKDIYVKNIKTYITSHIRLKSGSTVTDNISVDLGDIEINSSRQINVNFKSFLSTGAIKATSDNTFFTIGGKTTHDVTTGGVVFSANDNAGYDFQITYAPTSAGEHTGIITITDGTSTATVTIKANCVKKTATINWGSINNQIAVGETISLDGVTSTSGEEVVFESSNSEIIKVENKNLIALAPGSATITATARENNLYKGTTSSLVFEATQKTIQAIVWDQEFYLLKLGGEDITLNAVATNKETGSPNDRPIVYSVADESIVSVADGVLSIKKKGQTTITATQVGDEDYASVSVTKIVMVREVSSGCDDYFAVDAPDKVEKGNDGIFDPEGGWNWDAFEVTHQLRTVGDKLSFVTNCTSSATQKKIIVKDQNGRELYSSENFGTVSDLQLDRTVTAITISVKSNLTRSVSNIIVTPAIYVESDKAALNFADTEIDQTITETINVDWANQPDMLFATIVGDTEGVFAITKNSIFGGSCGDYGVTPISISFAPKKQGTYSANLIISMGEGAVEKLNIPITATAVYRETAFNKAGDWNDNNNWTLGVPTGMGKNATISAAVTIPNGYTAVANDITIVDGGSITIAPQGKLKINTIKGANASNFILQADEKGSAIFLLKNADEVTASIELFSISSSEGLRNGQPGNFKDPKWQYFGVTVAAVPYSSFNADGYSNWIYRWDEKGNARSCWAEKMTASSTLSAWNGYCIAQERATNYSYQGVLLNSDHSYQLTYTTEEGYSDDRGNNLITNSYTAPIDIATLSNANFNNAIANIYIYNTGSLLDWKSQQNVEGFNPGQVIVVPVNSISALGNDYPRTIASGQAFFVKAQEGGGSFNVDYDDNVYNAIRVDNQKRVRSVENDDFNVLKIRVTSSTSDDRLYLLEHKECCGDFDNGYDAEKIFDNINGPQIFATTQGGYNSVNTDSSFDGQHIGFVANSDEELYTITFDIDKLHSYDELYLYDLETDLCVDVLAGESYQFYGSTQKNDNRFIISAVRQNNSDIETALESISWDEMIAQGEKIFLYALNGQLLHCFERADLFEVSLPKGLYVVRCGEKSKKVMLGL